MASARGLGKAEDIRWPGEGRRREGEDEKQEAPSAQGGRKGGVLGTTPSAFLLILFLWRPSLFSPRAVLRYGRHGASCTVKVSDVLIRSSHLLQNDGHLSLR